MTQVVLDGDGAIAYFIGKHDLELGDVVIGVPFTKLLILLGQLCQAVIAPLFAGKTPTQRHGGDKPGKKKGSILS